MRSGAASEVASFRVDLDLVAFLDEEGDTDFQAGFELGRLGDTAASRIAAVGGLGIGDGELNLGGEMEADGVTVVLVKLEDDAFKKEVESVAKLFRRESEGVKGGLVKEVGAG
jgi:hypothetical protein